MRGEDLGGLNQRRASEYGMQDAPPTRSISATVLRDDIRTFRVKQGNQGRLLPVTRKHTGGDSSPTSPEIPESRASPSIGKGEWIILQTYEWLEWRQGALYLFFFFYFQYRDF